MHTHRETRNTALKIAAVFFALLLVLSMILFATTLWEQQNGGASGQGTELATERTYNGETYTLKSNVETLLVLGLDTFDTEQLESYTNNQQADFLLLLVLDKTTGSCQAIHINRDSMVDINVLGVAGESVGVVHKQIALSHGYGNGGAQSCQNTANAVSALLGVRVDHYVSVTMDAVSVFNDMVGGVAVEVMDDFSAIDPALVQGRMVTLTGEQALTYVRSRKGMEDPTNLRRMERQKQYLKALEQVARQKMQEDDGFLTNAVLKLSNYMVCDSGDQLESILSRFAENPPQILSIDGKSVAGEKHMEFYPYQESVDQVVIDCFYQKAQ